MGAPSALLTQATGPLAQVQHALIPPCLPSPLVHDENPSNAREGHVPGWKQCNSVMDLAKLTCQVASRKSLIQLSSRLHHHHN